MAQVQTTQDLGLIRTRPILILGGGAIAGIIGGVIMAMFAMAYAGLMGMGFLMPLKLIAATVFGKDAMAGGPVVLLVGLMIHMTASIAWGVAFAAVLPRTLSAGNALPIGIIYGIVIWAIMTFGVLPIVNPVMRESVSVTAGAWFIEHLLFGFGVGLGLVISKRVSSNNRSAAREVV